MLGKQILNYEIKSLIGEGGMGAVYLAEHTQVKRKVAIKVLLSRYLKNDELKQRFKNEASTLAHLQHPNIVGLYDYLEDETGMYLILEYVDGMQLDDYISQVTGPMPEEKSIPLMKQILSAFYYAHEKGIVHRDIKPANIIVTKYNEVKILDFGIARILGEGAQGMTKTGTQMGTVFYMSPEQVQGKKADFRSDIYSLGITFYQMLTGVNPYGNLTTEYEVYNSIVKEDLPPANEVYPGVSAKLVSILKKSLSKNPDERFQSCKQFLEAIESNNILQNESENLKSGDVSKSSVVVTEQKRSVLAIWSFVLSIVSLFFSGALFSFEALFWAPGLIFSIISFGLIFSIISLILSSKVLRLIKIDKTFEKSKGLANASRVFAIIALCLALIISIKDINGYLNKDSDGDGIKDRYDKCKFDYGVSSKDGCPEIDIDGDGVYDDYDNCPDEIGEEDNNGCPWPDSDADGVYDKDDNCPDVSGEGSNGCPEEGSYVFWFDSDVTGTWEGNVYVYVDDVYVGEIDSWYTDNPGCNSNGCVTVTRKPGNYRWSARTESGATWEGGEFNISVDNCGNQGLYLN
jgi:serine/threonine protein kinase